MILPAKTAHSTDVNIYSVHKTEKRDTIMSIHLAVWKHGGSKCYFAFRQAVMKMTTLVPTELIGVIHILHFIILQDTNSIWFFNCQVKTAHFGGKLYLKCFMPYNFVFLSPASDLRWKSVYFQGRSQIPTNFYKFSK